VVDANGIGADGSSQIRTLMTRSAIPPATIMCLSRSVESLHRGSSWSGTPSGRAAELVESPLAGRTGSCPCGPTLLSLAAGSCRNPGSSASGRLSSLPNTRAPCATREHLVKPGRAHSLPLVPSAPAVTRHHWFPLLVLWRPRSPVKQYIEQRRPAWLMAPLAMFRCDGALEWRHE